MRYRQGISTDFTSGYPDIFGEGSGSQSGEPYTGPSDTYQGVAGDYRQSPFGDPTGSAKPPGPATATATGSYQGQTY